MRSFGLRLQHLKTHFRYYNDNQLAMALGIEKNDIKAAREKHGLTRTPDEEKRSKDKSSGSPPQFDGMVPRPVGPHRLGRGDYLVALGASLVALAVYLLTLGPTITGEDSGELVTAAYTMGIAHPPGYPLWCILGKLFTFIPIGTIAWRVNLLSATFASATVFLTALIAIRATRSRLAGVVAGLAFAFSAEFWSQSVIAEVYALNTFFVALCVFLLLHWYDFRRPGALVAFAVMYGLSLTNHNTMHLLGPLFLTFVFFIDQAPWRRWKLYALCFGVSLIPLGVYAYLPLRAATHPPVNWGNPETFTGFWDVITRKQYAFGFTKNPRTLGRLLADTWAFSKLYAGEFTPWLAWVPAVGLYALWRKNRMHAAALLGFFLYVVFGFIVLLNFDIDKESLWLNNVFWIPAYLVAAVFIGTAVEALSDIRVGRVPMRYVSLLISVGVVALPLVSHYRHNDKSDYYWARDFGANVLNTLPRNAIYFPDADHATFPAIYLQSVEGMRTDVTIGNKYGYPEETLYADMPEETRGKFRKIPTDAEESIIDEWVVTHSNRPVVFSRKKPLSGLVGKQLVPQGLLYAVTDAGKEPPKEDWWAKYTWHTLEPKDTRGDLTAEFVLSDYWFARGRDFIAAGEKDKGLEALKQSIAVNGETKEALNNIGSLLAEGGLMEEASAYYAKTLKLDPKYPNALRNLAKLYMQKEQWEQAIALFDRLWKAQQMDEESMILSAQCLTERGRAREALERLQMVVQANPQNARAFRDMGFIYFNNLGDQMSAQRMFARSLEMRRRRCS